MENMMELLRGMRDDASNSIYLREIALLIEENEQLRSTIAKLKKGGGITEKTNILAEMNILKIMVCDLWEAHYGKIDKKEFREFKQEIMKKMKK